MLVAVQFRKKPVENMLPIVRDLIKQSFVSLFSELGRSWIRTAMETNTTWDKSLDALLEAVAKPHQAGEAYNSLAITADL